MELDGIFIDMYGTLTTGDRAAVEAVCREIIVDTGLRVSPSELAVSWGQRFFAAMDRANCGGFRPLVQLEADSLIQTMAELGITIDPYPRVRHLVDYWRNPPLQPETREFLGRFTVPICIVSNADRADLEAALRQHDIRVAAMVTSQDARSYKPDRRIFDLALAVTGWRRDRVIHVGDSLHSDVGGARAAGLTSGWVNRAHRIHDIGTARPDYQFADLLGLAELVRTSRPGRRPA